jgi:hypothetical protein
LIKEPTASEKADRESLDATWWLLDRVEGLDGVYAEAGESLDQMVEDLGIEIFRDRKGDKRLFMARYEFPQYEKDFTFSEAIFAKNKGNVVGFIDFLAGFPIDCCEMLMAIGQFSTKADKTQTKSMQSIVAPVPDRFFKWPDQNKVLFNITALPIKNYAKVLAPNLEGEIKPTKVHWWFRVNMGEKEVDKGGNETSVANKFPVPGEFLALGVRMMPDRPCGRQKSSPFLYSGNYMDTVYYTSAVITEVVAPTNDVLYPTYKVRWRKDEITARPSDFAEYKVGDRVTILKDVETDKTSQLWKDDDTKEFGETWQIVPITFYGLDKEKKP